VGALDEAEQVVLTENPARVAIVPDAPPVARAAAGFPWDFALLGGSVLGSIIGAFTFGIPALRWAWHRRRTRHGAGPDARASPPWRW